LLLTFFSCFTLSFLSYFKYFFDGDVGACFEDEEKEEWWVSEVEGGVLGGTNKDIRDGGLDVVVGAVEISDCEVGFLVGGGFSDASTVSSSIVVGKLELRPLPE